MRTKALKRDQLTLCVPVTDQKQEDIIAKILDLTAKKTEAIEWRIDYFEKGDQAESILELLEEIQPFLTETILILTYRSEREGGCGRLSRPDYEELLRKIASCQTIDYLDYEIMGSEDAFAAVKEFHAQGARLIASNHHFEGTPDEKEIVRILEHMILAEADIAKIAVMPKSLSDTMRLLYASALIKEKYPEQALITIAMGEKGAVTRLIGEATGSCLSFVTQGRASAPGQMTYQAVEQAREAIHLCLTEGENNEP